MLNDLSLRYKIPIRGTLLILITSLTVTAALVFRAYDDLKQDLLANAENVGLVIARTLVPAILKDDVWQSFKLIQPSVETRETQFNEYQPFQPESIIILNNDFVIYVASDPFRFPMLTSLENISPTYNSLYQFLVSKPTINTQILDLPKTDSLYVTTPIVSDNVRLGTLVMSYPRASFTPRFARIASRALIATFIALVLLIPLSWYWGVRMARPLIQLSSCMARVGKDQPAIHHNELYESKDEIGQLSTRFKEMLGELQIKKALEQQVISAERLAAVGRLTASIGHEINNPLGGMLNSINTYRRYGELDEMAEKTISLLERGLLQIKDTVSALLVEAKSSHRYFTSDDANDIYTLISPDIQRKKIILDWTVNLESIHLSATLIRQILINLLLNAIKAAPTEGKITCYITIEKNLLMITVCNNGEAIPSNQLSHLFEPFVHYRSDGNGLGLWVCYQIVNQLGGTIEVISNKNITRFITKIPILE